MNYEDIIKQLTGIDQRTPGDAYYFIDEILDHRWSKPKKGKVELLVKWRDYDEPSWEPLEIIREDDPLSVAYYAQKYNLLDKSIWKWAK